MSPTSTDQTLYTATRLRSSGATRNQTIDSLMGAGLRLAEANDQVDAIDTKLGMDGRTLPEDVSPTVRHAVQMHRDAMQTPVPAPAPTPASLPAATVAAAPETGPRFQDPVAPTPAADNHPRNVVPSVAELAAGTASTGRPTFVTPTPVTPEPGVATPKSALTAKEKATLRTSASRRARTATSAESVAQWLVREGMTEEEASSVARGAWRRAVNERQQAQSRNRGDQTMAWLEIIAGVALLIGGLAAGWFVGLFVFIIIDGFRRLGSA